ncbi:predicted protein [Botrytis cinerea T4]|uniref:Uncharacterized protein n=1 Tax=Botryotinia fuckeliana (strain T4) TaxID=999810 RepID=G2Y2U7_BOTF4|nr:predicted protein [Botrytis cinerea T4]
MKHSHLAQKFIKKLSPWQITSSLSTLLADWNIMLCKVTGCQDNLAGLGFAYQGHFIAQASD